MGDLWKTLQIKDKSSQKKPSLPPFTFACRVHRNVAYWECEPSNVDPKKCRHCGQPMDRWESASRFRMGKGERSGKGGWPMRSTALGTHRDDIPAHREFLRKQGITGFDFYDDGDMKINDAPTRKKIMKAYGLHDRSGFGGVTG